MTTGRINQVTTLKAKCQPPRGGRVHYHDATKVATRSVPLFKGTVCPIGTNFGAQRRLPQSQCTDAKLCGAILTGNCHGRTASHDHDGFPIDSTEFWPKGHQSTEFPQIGPPLDGPCPRTGTVRRGPKA